MAMPCELWPQGTGGSSAICSPERTSLSFPSLLDALLVQYRGEDDAVTSYLVVACSSHQWHHTRSIEKHGMSTPKTRRRCYQQHHQQQRPTH